MVRFIFNRDLPRPKDIVMVSNLFIKPEIIQEFEKHNCYNIWISPEDTRSYLWSFDSEAEEWIRCSVDVFSVGPYDDPSTNENLEQT